MKKQRFISQLAIAAAFSLAVFPPGLRGQMPQVSQTSAVKPIGAVKAISGKVITLASDSGTDLTVTISDSTRLLRTAPGQKDLKDATPIQLQDVQVGDRILVRGKPGESSNSLVASAVVVMKATDISQKQEQERQDWQKRGVGGLVSAVDPSTHVITISTTSLGSTKKTEVHVTDNTTFRRYADNSIKYEESKPAKFEDIKVGDQLRARGDRTADTTQITATEIVSGSFLNIPGAVVSTEPASNTIVVTDLVTKKTVTVKVTPESQLHKLPPMMAQRIAMRLKGGAAAGGPQSTNGSNGEAQGHNNGRPAATDGNGQQGVSGAGGQSGAFAGSGSAGPPDFQQILSRMPAVSVGELQKGDAVMIVATSEPNVSSVTAITLLSGVEPILSASQGDNRAAMALSPWNLAASVGDAAQ